MSNKRIDLMLIGSLPPPNGGISVWTKKIMSYCSMHGDFDITFIDSSIIGARANKFEGRANIFDEIKRCFRVWKSIRKEIKKKKISICHINSGCSFPGIIRDFISIKILKRKKIPVVLHCHCNIEDQIGSRAFPRKILKKVLNMSDGVIVLNRSSFDFVSNNFKKRVEIISNFIDGETIIERKKINNEIKKLVFVGRVMKTKGIDEIIHASSVYPQYDFFIVGHISQDYSNYKEIEKKCENLHFLGNIENKDVYKLLDESDVFLFPSYSEGFSIALLEAMARGMPCIASNVGANKDMIEDKGGVVFEAKDINAFITAIDSIKCPFARTKMSEWNIQKVKNTYIIDRIVEKMSGFYRSITDE